MGVEVPFDLLGVLYHQVNLLMQLRVHGFVPRAPLFLPFLFLNLSFRDIVNIAFTFRVVIVRLQQYMVLQSSYALHAFFQTQFKNGVL